VYIVALRWPKLERCLTLLHAYLLVGLYVRISIKMNLSQTAAEEFRECMFYKRILSGYGGRNDKGKSTSMSKLRSLWVSNFIVR